MPGSATIGPNLVDSLLGVVDELRDGLNTDMGVRQWRVFVSIKTYTSGKRGVGAFTRSETEITPRPRVRDSIRRELLPAGIAEAGIIKLTEISLTYLESELIPTLTAGQQLFYVLRDAQGQAIRDRYFTVAGPPSPDRESTIGWMLDLKIAPTEGVPC